MSDPKQPLGNILYACGHEIYDPDAPQDMNWQSEVECPNCSALANIESLADSGVFDIERELRKP